MPTNIVLFSGKCEMRVTKEDTIKVMKLVKACLKSVQTPGPVGFDD